VVHHGDAQLFGGPDGGGRIAALAGEIQRLQLREIMLGAQLALGVLLLDGAQGGGGGEQHAHLVLGTDAPEGAGIGRADRLALVHDAGAAGEQRGVDDVGMADDPADIAGRPVHVPGLDTVDHAHGVEQGDGVAAGVAHHALGLSGRAGGVEDVERIGGGHRHGVGRGGGGFGGGEIVVAARLHRGAGLRALEHQAGLRLVGADLDRLIHHRLVGHHAAGLEPAGGADDQLRLRILDALGQFGRGEAAEDHGMDGAEAGAGEHGDGGLGDHRHVDHHAVAAADA
jgi:hypothetical protein